MANENSNVVVDRAQSHWSDLWKKEDYWAIWLGFALLIAAICIFINGAPASYKETIDKSNAIMKVEAEKAPFKTIAYIQAQDAKKGVVGTNLPIAKEIKAFIASPGKWTDNPVKSMFTSQAEADAKNAANKEKAEAAKAKAESSFAAAQAAEKLAADAGYKDASLNTAAEAAIAAEYVDVLQIPAFLCRQTDLLVAAAQTGKIVNIKKGQFLSPGAMQFAVQKVADAGNNNVMVTERGTTFGYTDLVVDYRGIPEMQTFGYPVIMDVTHSLQQPNQTSGVTGGLPALIETIAKAAIAVGADGLFIETHPEPSKAKSDGANMLQLDLLEGLLTRLVRIREAIR